MWRFFIEFDQAVVSVVVFVNVFFGLLCCDFCSLVFLSCFSCNCSEVSADPVICGLVLKIYRAVAEKLCLCCKLLMYLYSAFES